MEDDLIPGDDIHIEPVQQGPRRRQRPPVDTLQGHPYLEFPDGTDAARHCQKLRRMHVGSHASIDWDAMEEIAETPRVRRFIPIDSPWHRLFDLAHTPTYRELLAAGREEIETEIYTAGLVVVEKPTLVGFWQVIAGADHWEHEKSKGRVSFVRDPLYRRPCALAHGLAQYFASGHHRQERGFLYGGAYVTVIARSLGLVPHQDPHLRTPAIMPTRMGMQSLWGMRVIRRFPIGPRFKNREGGVWTEQALPEHFEPVHPPADPADVVPVEDPPEDLDGAAEPQPPPPAGAPQFPRHVIRGRAPGAALHPDVRARLDRLDDLVGWLVRAEQDRRERERDYPRYRFHRFERHIRSTSRSSSIRIQIRIWMHRPIVVFIVIMDVQTYLIYFCYGCKQLSYICHIYVCF
ncbi:hypothetical protein HanHA89_Chr04g0171371 [Helianthus annuus]|nr:hypothetical protein HanHA89_Chr04g0171371 [Helianthus annuus]